MFRTLFVLAVISTLHAQEPEWIHLPGPAGGQVFGIAETPQGDVFCGTFRAIYRLNRASMGWEEFRTDIMGNGLRGIGPLLSLGAAHGVATTFYDTRTGESWKQDIRTAAMAPDGTIYGGAFPRGVVRSTDLGKTWQDFVLPEAVVASIQISSDGTIYVEANEGLYRISEDPSLSVTLLLEHIYGMYFGLHVFDDGEIAYSVDDYHGAPDSVEYVIRSRDRGASWDTLTINNRLWTFFKERSGLLHTIVYLSDYSLMHKVSTDDGVTWSDLNPLEYYVSGLRQLSTGEIIAQSQLGVQLFDPSSGTWSTWGSGLADCYVYEIVPLGNGSIIVSSDASLDRRTQYLQLSRDGGQTWEQSVEKTGALTADFNGNAMMMSGDTAISITRDNAGSWFTKVLPRPIKSPKIVIGMDDRIYIHGVKNVLWTSDDGSTWGEATFPDSLSFIREIAIDQLGWIYLLGWRDHPGGGVSGPYYWRSADRGTTWSALTISEEFRKWYVNSRGDIIALGESAGICRSTDKGLTWEYTIFRLPESTYYYGMLQLEPDIMTTGSGGLNYATFDGGITWVETFRDYAWNIVLGRDGYMYAGTHGRGIFRTKLVVDRSMKPTWWIAGYPNPFNGTTSLEFRVPKQTDLTCRIVDILGRTLEVLKDGPIGGGSYRVTWDASDYPSGIYFGVLTHSDGVTVQKMVLTR